MTVTKIFSKYSDHASAVLRLALAAVLINHGYMKLFGDMGIGGTTSFFASVGIPAASVMAVVVSVVEFFGGLAILLGLFARPAALLVTIQFIVIVLMKFLPTKMTADSFGKTELDIMVLATALALLFIGSGKLSLDKMLFKKELI